MIAVLVATPLVLRALRSHAPRELQRWVPRLAVGLPVVGLVVAFGPRPGLMAQSGVALLAHVTDPIWG